MQPPVRRTAAQNPPPVVRAEQVLSRHQPLDQPGGAGRLETWKVLTHRTRDPRRRSLTRADVEKCSLRHIPVKRPGFYAHG